MASRRTISDVKRDLFRQEFTVFSLTSAYGLVWQADKMALLESCPDRTIHDESPSADWRPNSGFRVFHPVPDTLQPAHVSYPVNECRTRPAHGNAPMDLDAPSFHLCPAEYKQLLPVSTTTSLAALVDVDLPGPIAHVLGTNPGDISFSRPTPPTYTLLKICENAPCHCGGM